MSGAVRGVAGTAHRRLTEVAGVAAETALIDASFRCSAEGKPAVFQIVNRAHRIFGQDNRRFLIHQVVAAFDRVEGVPFGFVLFDVAQSSTDTALGRAGMTAHGMQLGDHRGLGGPAGLQGGVQPRTPGSDYKGFKLVHSDFLGISSFPLPPWTSGRALSRLLPN